MAARPAPTPAPVPKPLPSQRQLVLASLRSGKGGDAAGSKHGLGTHR